MNESSTWALHPTLAADCHLIADVPGGLLLLQRNASLHWFLLVPRTQVLDLLDLPTEDQHVLLRQATAISSYLKGRLAYPRVNVGALGLVVPQLHLHVIGRRDDDPCWPAPVWGQLPPGPTYSDDDITRLRSELAALFA